VGQFEQKSILGGAALQRCDQGFLIRIRARLQSCRKPRKMEPSPAGALAIATNTCSTVEERRFQRRVKRPKTNRLQPLWTFSAPGIRHSKKLPHNHFVVPTGVIASEESALDRQHQ
jgi:hypothetical protein